MAVNPASPFYGTNRVDHYRAVYDVDVKAANPNDPTALGSSAKAQAIIIAGTLNGSGAIVPLISGSGGPSIADSLVVDAAGVYWILQDQGGGTFVYYKLSTLVVGTPTAPVVPAAGSNGIQIIEQKYSATAAATGYAIGDILDHILIVNINTNPPTISQSTWINITQGTILAGAPSPANINAIDDNVNATIVGTLPAFAAPPPVAQSGTWNVGITGTPPVTISGSVAVTGTFWQATQPVSAASLPLPAGAATSAGLITINTTLGSPFQAGGSIGNTGFNVTGTLPAFAAPPPVAQSGTWNITNISGTISLPTGAATSSNQTANTTAITNLAAQIPATLGQKAPAASLSIVSAGRTMSAYPLSMNGSSQTLVTAGQAATYLFVYNPVGNGSVTLNLAGAAAVAGSGVVLPAGASFELASGLANAVTAIGTNAQTLICYGGA